MPAKDMLNLKKTMSKKGIVYKARVEYYSKNGKRKQITKNFPVIYYGSETAAYNAARKWRDSKRAEVHQDVIVKDSKITIDEVFEKTLQSLSQSFETKRKWRLWYYKYVLRFITGDMPFSDITWDDHIKPSLDAMVNDCSQDLIDRIKSIWRKMCSYAYSRDLVRKNQFTLSETSGPILSKASIEPRNQKVDMAELRDLLNVFDEHKNDERLAYVEISAIKLMAYLGLRPAEVFVLNKNDFDLKNRTINIYRRLGSSKDERYVETSLGNKGYKRLVPYPSSLDDLINELIENSEDGKLFTVGGVFINSNTLSGDVHRISKGKITPYMLRHAFSNHLVVNKKKDKEGGDEDDSKRILTSMEQQKATQAMMGHNTLERTRSYTTDVSKDEFELAKKQEEEEKFNEQVKAVNKRAAELDDLGLLRPKGVTKSQKKK